MRCLEFQNNIVCFAKFYNVIRFVDRLILKQYRITSLSIYIEKAKISLTSNH